MAKNVQVTDRVLDLIEAATGERPGLSEIAVFEAVVASTRKITKSGSIFDGAEMSRSMLEEAAQKLNSGEEMVPLHTLHQQGEELPVGRVFFGQVTDAEDGFSQDLRALFYLPASETEIINNINLGVIDEVSVGMQSKQMLCSECGWDYLGEDADFWALFERTCGNGHTIDGNSVFLRLIGLERWPELSLVSRGASNRAKIQGNAKQRLAKETYQQIAADGHNPEAVVLFSNLPMNGAQTMNLDQVVAKLEDLSTNVAELKESNSEAQAKIAELTEAKAAADSQGSELQAEIETLQAKVTEAEEAKTEAEAKLAEVEEAKAEVEAKLEAKMSVPELPVGGIAASSEADLHRRSGTPALAAFKTRRH